jgi:hypothetical protein
VPSAEQVDMQMCHRLPAIRPRVDNGAIALLKMQRSRKFGNDAVHVAQQGIVAVDSLRERDNVPLRNHQNMRRRLRMHIREGHDLVIFKQQLCRNFSRSDFAENTIHTRQNSAAGLLLHCHACSRSTHLKSESMSSQLRACLFRMPENVSSVSGVSIQPRIA